VSAAETPTSTVPSLKAGRNARGSMTAPMIATATAATGIPTTNVGRSKHQSRPRRCQRFKTRTSGLSCSANDAMRGSSQ